MPNRHKQIPNVVFQAVASQKPDEQAPENQEQNAAETEFLTRKKPKHYFRFAFRIGTKMTSNRNATAAKSAISMHRAFLHWKAFSHSFNPYQSVVLVSDSLGLLLCR